jgi:transcriptional antiterminator RfaH
MPYWACAQVRPQHERLALCTLEVAGYVTYWPRLRELRRRHGRKIEICPALFPGYVFFSVQLQWYRARWCPGVVRLVMDGLQPARVPDAVIEELKGRERNGAIEFPRRLKPGDQVRILQGPFEGHLAIYAGMSGSERVAVLLQILGGAQRVTLSQRDIEAIMS